MICAWGIDTEIDEWAVILREDTVIQSIYFVFRFWYSYRSYYKLLHTTSIWLKLSLLHLVFKDDVFRHVFGIKGSF